MSVSVPDGSFIDTTLRPICFSELGRVYSPAQAKTVGAEKFKKYEYILYILAQLSRIVYCDTGVAWEVIQKGLGLSNDVVNKMITLYDKEYLSEARTPMGSPPGINGRPMRSYIVKGQQESISKTPNFGTYVSTGHDVTCLLVDASKIKSNANSIFTQDDIIITFKGSSTIQNFIDDLKSMKPSDFSRALEKIGMNVAGLGNIAGGFIFPLLHAFESLKRGLKERLEGKKAPRIFVTGHSLGGAYATLFGWILGLMKKSSSPELQAVQSIHIVTYGAPLLFSDTARNQFNSLLDEGILTFDRVVSQQIASIKTAVAGTLGKAVSGADIIPTIPPGFSHPGYQPLITEFYPEKNGRPYGFQNIRTSYGVESAQKYRDLNTWPFEEGIELGNSSRKKNLNSVVAQLTQVSESEVAALTMTPIGEVPVGNTITQQGGLFGIGEEKTKYEKLTKQHIPNFVSVIGSKWALSFAHAEYMGMFFFGAMRTVGRKNPVPTGDMKNVATFSLTEEGVAIEYNFGENVQGGGKKRKSKMTKKAKKLRMKKRKTRKY